MSLTVPNRLAIECNKTPTRAAWLKSLAGLIRELERRWSIVVGDPYQSASCAWVAPAERPDGAIAVLKVGMPHFENTHESQGLRFWNADATVQLYESDDELGAMLLERCVPGTPLSTLPELDQDVVICDLLKRLWRAPEAGHPFRSLTHMVTVWAGRTAEHRESWPDAGLVAEGLALFLDLPLNTPTGDVLLATDLHAGNVLRAERSPWLVIDPKPFVGDPSYDVTQHLFNCPARMHKDPHGTIARVADLASLDSERVRLWTFARLAAEPRDDWSDKNSLSLARALAP